MPMWTSFLTAVVCALFVALLKGNEQVSRINKDDLLGSAVEFEIEGGAEESGGLIKVTQEEDGVVETNGLAFSDF